MTRSDTPSSVDHKATRPLERVHMDVVGPMPKASHNGCYYFVNYKDEHSSLKIVYPIRTKDRVPATVIRFYADVAKVRAVHPLLVLKRDNAKETTSAAVTEIIERRGTKSEFSAPYHPRQNGVVERSNRTILDIARTNMIQSGCFGPFWARAVCHAASISNV